MPLPGSARPSGGTLLLCLGLAACDPPPDQADAALPGCDEPTVSATLSDEIAESSGVATSIRHPGVFWTHNDSGWEPHIFAIDSTGAVLGRVRVHGATNRDWEDIELAPCEPGSSAHCLFIGDIGDNDERYDTILIYRIPEPDPRTDTLSRPATVIRATYAHGPRDAEALFVTDRGIHIINKGRSHAIELYRIPPPYTRRGSHRLEPRQRIAPPPTSISAQVTAAAASPQGDRIVVRSYGGLRFFRPEADSLREVGAQADLILAEQRQGEGVDFTTDGRLVITSEAAGSSPAHLAILRCEPPSP